MLVHLGTTPGAGGVIKPEFLQEDNVLFARVEHGQTVVVEKGKDNPGPAGELLRLVPGAEYTHSTMVHIFGMRGFMETVPIPPDHEMHYEIERMFITILKELL